MATHVLRSSDTFPVGTTVFAYPRSNWDQGSLPPSGTPRGSSTTSAVVQSDGTVTLTGLTEDVAYFAAGQVSSVWRYVQFRVDTTASPWTRPQAITPAEDATALTLGANSAQTIANPVLRIENTIDRPSPHVVFAGKDRGNGTPYLSQIGGAGGSNAGLITNGYIALAGQTDATATGFTSVPTVGGESTYMLGVSSDVGAAPAVVFEGSSTAGSPILRMANNANAKRWDFTEDGTVKFGAQAAFLVAPDSSSADAIIKASAPASQAATLTLLPGAVSDANALKLTAAAAGTSAFLTLQSNTIFRLYSAPGGGSGAAMSVGGEDDTSAIGLFSVVNSLATRKGIVSRGKSTQSANLLEVQESGGTAHIFATAATSALRSSLVVGSAALTTTATDGFLYLPTCAGAPTGVPTARTGTVAHVYDTTNNRLYVYNGAWKSVVLA